MNSGKERRLSRIFRPDGRSLTLAIDHGTQDGLVPGLEAPERILAAAKAAGVDAILAGYGLVSQFARQIGTMGVVLRMDAGVYPAMTSADRQVLHSAEDAVRIGADAAICMLFPGAADGRATLTRMPQLAAQCQAWGLPLIVEALPWGFDRRSDAERNREAAGVARLAAELGADVVKVRYTAGDPAAFRRLVQGCYVPVLLLGGGKGDPLSLLQDVAAALDAGAAGVAIGRNVFQRPDPALMLGALGALVHDGRSVQQAEAMLEGR